MVVGGQLEALITASWRQQGVLRACSASCETSDDLQTVKKHAFSLLKSMIPTWRHLHGTHQERPPESDSLSLARKMRVFVAHGLGAPSRITAASGKSSRGHLGILTEIEGGKWIIF